MSEISINEESMVFIKRIDVFSLAKILGVLHAAIGFIIGLLMSVAVLIGAADGEQILFGALAVIFLPAVNLVVGFIGGGVVAFIYNSIGSLLGGIKIQIKEV